MISVTRPLVWLGADSTIVLGCMVMGLDLRAYSTGTPRARAVVSAGAMPLISAVKTLLGCKWAKRAANAPPTASIKVGSTWWLMKLLTFRMPLPRLTPSRRMRSLSISTDDLRGTYYDG